MSAYYNEIEPYCVEWLRNLIAAGHLPAGDVDERPIQEVSADDLEGYDECHFFAGIGGWPYALRLAGWDDPVWTGSCPCQPLSSAGQRRGHADERHLWPAFHALIAERRPATVFGEQVASKDGREWLAGVRADLEHVGYAVGAADLPAACVGAPHIRQRLFWVADANQGQCGRLTDGQRRERNGQTAGRIESDGLAQSGGSVGGLGNAASDQQWQSRPSQKSPQQQKPAGGSGLSDWSAFDLIPCGDGKARRTEPSIQPLAHGVSNRVGRLRGYGNAIVPKLGAAFVAAFMECRP